MEKHLDTKERSLKKTEIVNSSANETSQIQGTLSKERRATKRQSKGQSKKVFVGGLNNHTKKADIWNYFSAFGKVNYVDVVKEKVTKARRGFCFVTFSKKEFALKAAETRFHAIKKSRVEVKLALSKESMSQKSVSDSRLTAAIEFAKINNLSFLSFKLNGGQSGQLYFNRTIEHLKAI